MCCRHRFVLPGLMLVAWAAWPASAHSQNLEKLDAFTASVTVRITAVDTRDGKSKKLQPVLGVIIDQDKHAVEHGTWKYVFSVLTSSLHVRPHHEVTFEFFDPKTFPKPYAVVRERKVVAELNGRDPSEHLVIFQVPVTSTADWAKFLPICPPLKVPAKPSWVTTAGIAESGHPKFTLTRSNSISSDWAGLGGCQYWILPGLKNYNLSNPSLGGLIMGPDGAGMPCLLGLGGLTMPNGSVRSTHARVLADFIEPHLHTLRQNKLWRDQ